MNVRVTGGRLNIEHSRRYFSSMCPYYWLKNSLVESCTVSVLALQYNLRSYNLIWYRTGQIYQILINQDWPCTQQLNIGIELPVICDSVKSCVAAWNERNFNITLGNNFWIVYWIQETDQTCDKSDFQVSGWVNLGMKVRMRLN